MRRIMYRQVGSSFFLIWLDLIRRMTRIAHMRASLPKGRPRHFPNAGEPILLQARSAGGCRGWGVACVSYNVLPGWPMLQPLRDAFMLSVPDQTDSLARVAKARELLELLKTATTDNGFVVGNLDDSSERKCFTASGGSGSTSEVRLPCTAEDERLRQNFGRTTIALKTGCLPKDLPALFKKRLG